MTGLGMAFPRNAEFRKISPYCFNGHVQFFRNHIARDMRIFFYRPDNLCLNFIKVLLKDSFSLFKDIISHFRDIFFILKVITFFLKDIFRLHSYGDRYLFAGPFLHI